MIKNELYAELYRVYNSVSIEKAGKKRIWVKPTSKKKGHWRMIEAGAGDESKVKLQSLKVEYEKYAAEGSAALKSRRALEDKIDSKGRSPTSAEDKQLNDLNDIMQEAYNNRDNARVAHNKLLAATKSQSGSPKKKPTATATKKPTKKPAKKPAKKTKPKKTVDKQDVKEQTEADDKGDKSGGRPKIITNLNQSELANKIRESIKDGTNKGEKFDSLILSHAAAVLKKEPELANIKLPSDTIDLNSSKYFSSNLTGRRIKMGNKRMIKVEIIPVNYNPMTGKAILPHDDTYYDELGGVKFDVPTMISYNPVPGTESISYTPEKDKVIEMNNGSFKMSDISQTREKTMELIKEHHWDINKAKLFTMGIHCHDDVIAHVEDGKIYGLSNVTDVSGSKNTRYLDSIEVNPDMKRQGYGTKIFKTLITTALDEGINTFTLSSYDADSDAFYTALGMERLDKNKYEGHNFKGDKKWMKEFIKST